MNREERAQTAKRHLDLINKLFSKDIEQSIDNSKIYLDGYRFEEAEDKGSSELLVVKADTVSALYKYKEGDTAILNFASFKNPGGGYLSGSSAQEEAICTESTLYPVLSSFERSFYDPHRQKGASNRCLYNSDAIYSPDIVFTKNGNFIKAGVITIAAPNISKREECGLKDNEIQKTLKDRIKTIYEIGNDNNINTLILGAFGCGVFKNDPHQVARIFKEYSKDSSARKIVFAIYSEGENLNAFKEEIE